MLGDGCHGDRLLSTVIPVPPNRCIVEPGFDGVFAGGLLSLFCRCCCCYVFFPKKFWLISYRDLMELNFEWRSPSPTVVLAVLISFLREMGLFDMIGVGLLAGRVLRSFTIGGDEFPHSEC